MTTQTNTEDSNIRQLTDREIDVVAGGVSPDHLNGKLPFDWKKWLEMPYIA